MDFVWDEEILVEEIEIKTSERILFRLQLCENNFPH